MFGPANQVTATRAVLVAVLAALLVGPLVTLSPVEVAAISAAAVLLDGVDGWLARRTGTSSRFGARFDMEVDAALILVLAGLAWQHGKAGAWVLAAGLLRYCFVAAGWVLPWMRRELPPSFRRKAICVVQAAVLILIIFPFVVPPLSTWLASAALGALVYSFYTDTSWLFRHRVP
jgi:phosphatidylglycerophosphate synthase